MGADRELKTVRQFKEPPERWQINSYIARGSGAPSCGKPI
jgi:hypothetical protein